MYLESVLPPLVDLLLREGYEITVLGAGALSLRARVEHLLEAVAGKYHLEWRRDPFGSRYLGVLSDLVYLGRTDGIFHGMSNTFPFIGGGKRNILTLHDLLQPFPVARPPSLYRSLRTSYYRLSLWYLLRFRIDAIVTGHERSQRELQARYPKRRATQLGVVFPPLTPRFLEKLDPLPESVESEYLVAFVSSDPRKNFPRLLAAFEGSGTEFVLKVIVGEGHIVEEIRQVVANSPAVDRIEVVHGLDREELCRCIERSRAVLFPSLAEGFGYPIYESLARGVPVLTSPDLLISAAPRSEAMVIPRSPYSVEALIEGIQCITELQISETVRRESIEEIHALLSPQRCAEALMSYYETADTTVTCCAK
ncbi:glycosyltransferase [bacterium]|nr:glycosyltransferase [bacterium]